MPTKKKPPVQVKSPFPESFIPEWEHWKTFKKEQFRFTYKPIGEEAALKDLYEMSAGNELMAKAIITQSIKNGWRGLFDIKTNGNGSHIKNTGIKPTPQINAQGSFGKL